MQRDFGRKPRQVTPAQRSARRVAVGCLIGFAVALTASLTVADVGSAIVFGLAAFSLLATGVAAAGES